ncbi:hypothetical protein BG011_010141 [Mortierella polycephala]|uniref:Uncharacterized protein n=1 Tax=Mortierella polycephala TaxID=41804 RepID=A0A9P6PLT7_9FUNG|nr:hypothetical protein BG011_010141 [Mortierella polycephala]
MVSKTHSTFAFFAILICHSLLLVAEAAPIARLFSFIPSTKQIPRAIETELLPLPQPSLGRAQIRPIQRPARLTSSSPYSSDSLPSLPSASDSESAPSVWYILHQRQQQQQQQPQQPIAPIRSFQTQGPQHSQDSWSGRTLEGHAVIDDDDDDAGNELLDTEANGLLRPDADDEIEGTIEGEVLEEEGDEADESDDMDDDDEMGEAWDGVIGRFSAVANLPHKEAMVAM